MVEVSGEYHGQCEPRGGKFGCGNRPYSNFYNRRADCGPVENDIEHRFTLSSVYELPFGKKRRWVKKGIWSRLAGDWTFGAVTDSIRRRRDRGHPDGHDICLRR